MIKNLFGKELCNTERQIEFDIAKVVCILGMVYVHCFEYLTAPEMEESAAYFVVAIVLDALFGAVTFMSSMGIGLAYTWKESVDNATKTMRRGLQIFLFGYLLNVLRYGIPELIFAKSIPDFTFSKYVIVDTFQNDIMQFAGLALMLFGFLKRIKLSDKAIAIVALAMSLFSSFARFIYIDNIYVALFAGLFLNVESPLGIDYGGVFSLTTWFIFVVGGYLYGKVLKHCKDKKKYYSIALPVSATIAAIYMLIAIPNKFGMMNGNLSYFYQMTTFEALISFCCMIFATSMYYFISLALKDKAKRNITRMSSNINRIYCIHWIFVGWTEIIFLAKGDGDSLSTLMVFIYGTIIYIVSNILAEIYARYKESKRLAQQN